MGSGRLAHSLVVVVGRRSPCPVSPDGVNVTEGDLHPHTECLSSLTAFLGQWPCLAPGTATRPPPGWSRSREWRGRHSLGPGRFPPGAGSGLERGEQPASQSRRCPARGGHLTLRRP